MDDFFLDSSSSPKYCPHYSLLSVDTQCVHGSTLLVPFRPSCNVAEGSFLGAVPFRFPVGGLDEPLGLLKSFVIVLVSRLHTFEPSLLCPVGLVSELREALGIPEL